MKKIVLVIGAVFGLMFAFAGPANAYNAPNPRLFDQEACLHYSAGCNSRNNVVIQQDQGWNQLGCGNTCKTSFQNDCNFVWYLLYGGAWHAQWASNTSHSQPYDCQLILQGDANVVVYHGSTPLWASGTNDIKWDRDQARIYTTTMNGVKGLWIQADEFGTSPWHTHWSVHN